MQSISLEQLRNLLQQTPVMAQINPLSLAFLNDEVQVFATVEELVATLDAPDPQLETPMVALTLDERFVHRLPSVRCDHDPFTTELNRFLLLKIDWVQRWVLCQWQINKVICQRVSGDCIVLILVDGLSFANWKRFMREGEATAELFTSEPFFVDGVSITEYGMRRIVGEPTIAFQLAELGYKLSFGFSYWELTNNELTDKLFAGITEGVQRVKSFGEVLEQLPKLPLEGSFVQIVRQGLDQVGHRYLDLPNIVATVQQIFDELQQIHHCAGATEKKQTWWCRGLKRCQGRCKAMGKGCWLALILVCGFATFVAAQQTPSDVAFGGEYFFRFRASAGGLSPEVRASVLQSRLTHVFTRLLAQGAQLSVHVRSLGAMRVISVAGVPFVTVTLADAEANQMAVEQLAKVWANNLEEGLRRILSSGSSH